MLIIERQETDNPHKTSKEHILVCDGLAEFVNASQKHHTKHCNNTYGNDWYGGKSYDTACDHLINGDLSCVAESDALLTKFESISPVTPTFTRVHDVIGNVPNVSAVLAGHPLTMIRRQRANSELAPLTIIVSLELSGTISAKRMRQRGMAILALVRLLAIRRPIEVWAACGYGSYDLIHSKSAHTLVRLDCAPLDLARVAPMLADPACTRRVNYNYISAVLAKMGTSESFFPRFRASNPRRYASALGINHEHILYIPSMYDRHDPATDTPEQWLSEMLNKFSS